MRLSYLLLPLVCAVISTASGSLLDNSQQSNNPKHIKIKMIERNTNKDIDFEVAKLRDEVSKMLDEEPLTDLLKEGARLFNIATVMEYAQISNEDITDVLELAAKLSNPYALVRMGHNFATKGNKTKRDGDMDRAKEYYTKAVKYYMQAVQAGLPNSEERTYILEIGENYGVPDIIDLMADDSNFEKIKHTFFKKWKLSIKD